MRTTLDIDMDVLEAAKEISARTRSTAGRVLSDLARKALSSAQPLDGKPETEINGFEVMRANGRVVTSELVKKLMEESDRT